MAMLRKFSITALPQAFRNIEIARYCTRIRLGSKQVHKKLLQTSSVWLLCDPFHGAKSPLTQNGAPKWFTTLALLNQNGAHFPLWCILNNHATRVKWHSHPFHKVGTDFAINHPG
ncbi:hypothetical protein BS640_19885 [Rouxiella badensis]|uniref:Uncharacterized protein n=1 Tax=Rouxiella badensis TaxID=1646377 RepID=A0A1X0WAA5_9GAMM|nr:hypothetical protein BS640_19885 [Rouxiella badensis]